MAEQNVATVAVEPTPSCWRNLKDKVGPIIDSEWHLKGNTNKHGRKSGQDIVYRVDNTRATKKPALSFAKVADIVAPPLILALIAYGIYAYCFKYAWQYVGPRHGHGRSIVLVTLFCCILFMALFCWAMILGVGPGRVQQVISSGIPEVFMCDPYGFRQWCSTCGAIKPDRAHHSGQVGYCVPNMDHFCSWLASVIGAGNIKFFIQFLMYVVILMVYSLVTLLIYAHHSPLPTNVIVMYAIAAFLNFLLGGFLMQHVRYIATNITTLEHMDIRRSNYPIFCFECDGKWVVSRVRKEDTEPWGPYSQGYYRNWCNVMGRTVLHWFLPVPVQFSENVFNSELLEILRERYRKGEEGYVAQFQPGPDSTGQGRDQSHTSASEENNGCDRSPTGV
jgi:palmitoyltransferase